MVKQYTPFPVEDLREGHDVSVSHDDGDTSSLHDIIQRCLTQTRAAQHETKCSLLMTTKFGVKFIKILIKINFSLLVILNLYNS